MAKAALEGGAVRIGFASPNFPGPDSFLTGELEDVRSYQKRLTEEHKSSETLAATTDGLVAQWKFGEPIGSVVVDVTGHNHDAVVHEGKSDASTGTPILARRRRIFRQHGPIAMADCG